MATSVVPVILCGGSGSRLWPMSRRLLPKQFLPLAGEKTLFQKNPPCARNAWALARSGFSTNLRMRKAPPAIASPASM